jgi:hypothetical protein
VGTVLDRYAHAWSERLRSRHDEERPHTAELSTAWLELEGELRGICSACALALHEGHH